MDKSQFPKGGVCARMQEMCAEASRMSLEENWRGLGRAHKYGGLDDATKAQNSHT